MTINDLMKKAEERGADFTSKRNYKVSTRQNSLTIDYTKSNYAKFSQAVQALRDAAYFAGMTLKNEYRFFSGGHEIWTVEAVEAAR